MEFEKFKDIPLELSNRYMISKNGNVISIKLHYKKWLQKIKPYKNYNGYISVELFVNKKRKNFYLHRLLAITYISNPENKPHINHIDGNPSNNSLSNLEWVTPSENMKHSFDVLGRKPTWLGKKGAQHNRSKKVKQLDKKGNLIKVWGGVRYAERELGANSGHISCCCLGKRKTHKGFKWAYF